MILRKPPTTTEAQPWMRKVTVVTQKITFDWVLQVGKTEVWEISKKKYDIWPKKDVLGKIKTWDGTGIMPPALVKK